ncbi:MAG: M20 family metallopeptidase [Dehalococcoidia bacterium]|nr:M20 family metallopeptidase [Dehalococcoidia bacterium]
MNIPARSRLRPEVAAVEQELVETRRAFHRIPELSWKEERTRDAILERLHAIPGLEDVRPLAGTGATALVCGGGPGPCVLWRADIDALPIPEKSGLPFASENEGVMHACGHDAHIAIGLALAQLLAARRSELQGSVRFVFQPAEEADGGARACIDEGILDQPRVATPLGLHISADVPLGSINVAPGPFFAAPTSFRIEITGRGGHAASPQQGVDAVVVAAHCVTALQTVVSRSISPLDSGVLTIGTIKAGYRGNVIAESALLSGTIRSYTSQVRETMLERTREIVAGVCAAFGATADVWDQTSCPPLENDETVTAMVQREAAAFFGEDRIYAVPSMGAEDMGEFLQERPGCYFWLGARNEGRGIAGRHHDPGFVIDEAALPLGVEFGLRVIEAALRESDG